MSHSLIRCKKPSCVSTGAVYLKCKTSELFLKLFCLFGSFRNCLILFLHIESLYKVGQRYLFRQVLAPFVQLIGNCYRFQCWYLQKNSVSKRTNIVKGYEL